TFLPFRAYNTDNQLIIDTALEIAESQSLESTSKHQETGKHRTQVGQAPCPKWASTVPKTVPKVSIEGNVSKGI
ncbi:hypothetical protein, partial [Prevotella pectinovora]|uniref:hypothetical protein n=1 Tax=Prevotella pectinovora TaxID=1602169 RepID=UPI00307D1903